MTLRSKLIRLAHTNPELRAHLLPLLKASNAQVEGPVAGSDGNYMTKQNLWLTQQMAESLYNAIPDGMLLPDWAESKINSAADHIKAVAGWAMHAMEKGNGGKTAAKNTQFARALPQWRKIENHLKDDKVGLALLKDFENAILD